MAVSDATLMMTPFCFCASQCVPTSLHIMKTAARLVCNTSSYASYESSSTGKRRCSPAAFSRMSTVFEASTSLMLLLTASRSDTSHSTSVHLRPSDWTLDCVSVFLTSLCDQRQHCPVSRQSLHERYSTWKMMTSAPDSASPRAMDCPMPFEPPVTSAVFPVRSNRPAMAAFCKTRSEVNLRQYRCSTGSQALNHCR